MCKYSLILSFHIIFLRYSSIFRKYKYEKKKKLVQARDEGIAGIRHFLTYRTNHPNLFDISRCYPAFPLLGIFFEILKERLYEVFQSVFHLYSLSFVISPFLFHHVSVHFQLRLIIILKLIKIWIVFCVKLTFFTRTPHGFLFENLKLGHSSTN